MSILKELSAFKPPVVKKEVFDKKYEALLESIEDLYEKWSLFGNKKDAVDGEVKASSVMKDPTKKLSMSRIHTVMLSPSDKSFGLKDKVFGIRNEDPIISFMLDILGVPTDGSPIRIRTGFMQYDERSKMLFVARFKNDLPGERQAVKESTKDSKAEKSTRRLCIAWFGALGLF